MIFFGDGDTDIPAMKMLKYQGGTAVAVFDSKQFRGRDQEKVYKLIAEDRANYVCPADYTDGSLLDVTAKGILGRIARATGYRPLGKLEGPEEVCSSSATAAPLERR